MGWSETLGQVLQTRPVLAYGASYLGRVIATASPCILAGTFTGVIESFLASKSARMGLIIQQAAGVLLFLAGAYIFFQGVRSW